jgi:DNA-binding transcriptional LysR family regulator
VEADLGLRLFHRTTRRVTITAAGERLRLRAERTVAELRAIVQELNDEAQLKRGRVVLGATTTVAAVSFRRRSSCSSRSGPAWRLS